MAGRVPRKQKPLFSKAIMLSTLPANPPFLVAGGGGRAGTPPRKRLAVRREKRGKKPAVAVAAHADPRGVDIGMGVQPANGRLDVLQLRHAQFLVGDPGRAGPFAAGAARIAAE